MPPPSENAPTAQERAWAFICKYCGTFTTRDVASEGDMSYDSAQGWVKRLADAGLIEQVGRRKDRGQAKRYVPCRRHAENGTRASLLRAPPEVSKRGPDWKQEAWTAMRIKRRFTVAAVLVTLSTEVKHDTVYRYCRMLEQEGYLRTGGQADKFGSSMIHRIYELARDAGPERPFKPSFLPG